jgi:integrase
VTSSLFAWAERQGLVSEGHANPASKIERYKEQARERFLTGEELGRLGDALRANETIDPFAVAAIRLLILTGARLLEILHAKWQNVDIDRGIIFVPDSKTGLLKCGGARGPCELPRLEGNSHIFPGQKEGAPRFRLQKPWVAVRRSAGLDGLRIHDLRHSFASIGAGASLGLPIIGKLPHSGRDNAALCSSEQRSGARRSRGDRFTN